MDRNANVERYLPRRRPNETLAGSIPAATVGAAHWPIRWLRLTILPSTWNRTILWRVRLRLVNYYVHSVALRLDVIEEPAPICVSRWRSSWGNSTRLRWVAGAHYRLYSRQGFSAFPKLSNGSIVRCSNRLSLTTANTIL
jgi:hypothetical protein